MKLFRSLLGFLILSLFVISCKKERSTEDGKTPNVIEEAWEFSESGQIFNGPIDSAYIEEGIVNRLVMVGTATGRESGEFFLQIEGQDFTVGTYTNPSVFFQYSENGGVVFQSSPAETSAFTLDITLIDSTTISGTFTGEVQDSQGNMHTVTNGKFKSKISGSHVVPPLEDVKLTVWSRSICNDGGPIEIRVGGQVGQITAAMDLEPMCDEAGAATFTLPVSDYTVEAICGTDTVRYDISLINQCNILEVDLQTSPLSDDYLPLTLTSFWNYADLSDAGNTQRITVVATEEDLDGRNYTRLESTTGDAFHFRKEGHVYYEYRTLDFQGSVTDPPSIEVAMLHDDYDAGQSWETPGIDVVLSGIGVKIKLVSTISRRDYDDTFNSINYANLIEVNTEILFSSDGGNNYQSSGNSYSTVFAKGIGIVYYFDLNRDTEWGITDYFLSP